MKSKQIKYKNFILKYFKNGCCDVYENNYREYVGFFQFDFKKYVFRSTCTLFDKIEDIYQSKNSSLTKDSTDNDFIEQIKKGLQFYLKYQKTLIERTIQSYNFYLSINDFDFDLTCDCAPQQYDVYKNGKYIGYIRIRHGTATFSNQPIGDIVYLCKPHQYNKNVKERTKFLEQCIKNYLNYKGE